MIRLFIDGPLFIKIFASSFTSLGAMTTGAFYYSASKYSKEQEQIDRHIAIRREQLEAQEEYLGKLRRTTIQ
ncbi:hypothetical protein [Mycoplasma suis]|uniref:Uncharacterized protein n=1 Tax=Mycoplasma suis (strain Illinois) TaxID=768700 RepID=F0QS89_MYCSL|nr:hypothetical protein [Mycoplasma suis]ADX98359.1 hypothetical protein MSU_0838 [Mycoplasma suis str. Illinois]